MCKSGIWLVSALPLLQGPIYLCDITGSAPYLWAWFILPHRQFLSAVNLYYDAPHLPTHARLPFLVSEVDSEKL